MTSSLSTRLDAEYKALWEDARADDVSEPTTEEWQGVLSRFFITHPDPELALTEWDAGRAVLLETATSKFQASGAAYFNRIDDRNLTDLFIATVPKSFRILLSKEQAGADGTGPFEFPIKRCFALWSEIEKLQLTQSDQFDVQMAIAEQWSVLDEYHAELAEQGVEPLHGTDFWKSLMFEAVLKKKTVFTEGEDVILGDVIIDRVFAELEFFSELQLAMRDEKEFPRMFLNSRTADGYGLPLGVKIPEELQLVLYQAWVDLENPPTVKSIRSKVRAVREKIEEQISLNLLLGDPEMIADYEQSVFQHLLFTLVQGDQTFYQDTVADLDRKLVLGRAWSVSRDQLHEQQRDLVSSLDQMERQRSEVGESTVTVLQDSQDLHSWYNPEPYLKSALLFPMVIADPNADYARADESVRVLASNLAQFSRSETASDALKIEYAQALKDCLEQRIAALKAVGYVELIQIELFMAYQGNLIGFESGTLPYTKEIFTASYLESLGLDFSAVDDGDSINQAIRSERWSDAWRGLGGAVHRDFYTCTTEGTYGEIVPEREEVSSRESMAPPGRVEGPKPGSINPDKERMAWRLDQLSDLMSRDPDFVVFNEFMEESQPVIITMNSLLMGIHDANSGEDLRGYLHPSMNRPEEAIVLLKRMAEQFKTKYYSGRTAETDALHRALGKLSGLMQSLDPERLNLSPEEEQFLQGLKGIVGLMTPQTNGKSSFQSLLETVADPGFTTYTFERAVYVYGPDVAGAVAGAVLISVATGGMGSVAVGASWFVRGIRFVSVIMAMSAGSVAGKEIARLGMEGLGWAGLVPDYGVDPLSKQYLNGTVSGDEAFVRIFGEAGRELFVLMGFDRTDPDTGLGKLFEQYEAGQVDMVGMVYRLLGEYGYQAATMLGVSVFAKGLGAVAGRMILSKNPAIVLAGRSIEKFSGVFDSLSDRIVMERTGEMAGMSGLQMAKMFFGEMAEESIEQTTGMAVAQWTASTNKGHAAEYLVAILNSGRVNVPDLAGVTMHAHSADAQGRVSAQLTYTRGKIDELTIRLDSLGERNAHIEARDDGTVVYRYTNAKGHQVVHEYKPSDVPLNVRQALMVTGYNTNPETILAEIGVSGWTTDGRPVWESNADVASAVKALRAMGFIVNEEIVSGTTQLKLSWSDQGKVSSLILPVGTSVTNGGHDGLPGNLIRRFSRFAGDQIVPLIYWNSTAGTYDSDLVPADDEDTLVTQSKPDDILAAAFQPSAIPSSSVVSKMRRQAQTSPGQDFTIRIYDVSTDPQSPLYVDYVYSWNEDGMSIQIAGGTATVVDADLAAVRESTSSSIDIQL